MRAVTVVGAFSLAAGLIASLLFWVYWNRFKEMKRRFNYRITDIWAATLALSPTLALAAYVAKPDPEASSDSTGLLFWICAVIGLGLFQVVGLAAGRMDIEIRERELGPVTAGSSAISIVTGAILGLFASALFTPLAFGVAIHLK